jgi:hypothetical protein
MADFEYQLIIGVDTTGVPEGADGRSALEVERSHYFKKLLELDAIRNFGKLDGSVDPLKTASERPSEREVALTVEKRVNGETGNLIFVAKSIGCRMTASGWKLDFDLTTELTVKNEKRPWNIWTTVDQYKVTGGIPAEVEKILKENFRAYLRVQVKLPKEH